MGKTVPSYRIALEWEIDRWKGFRKALDNEEDQAVLKELMDIPEQRQHKQQLK